MLPGTSGNNAFARQTYETVGALGDSLRVTFDSESSFVQVDLNMLPPGQPYYNDIVIEVSGETSVVSLTGARGIPVTHSVSGRFAGQSFTVTQVPGTEIYYLKFNGPITFDVPGDIENTDVGIASNGCPGTGPCPLSGNNPIPGASSLGLVLASLLTLAFGVFFLRNRRGRHTFAA